MYGVLVDMWDGEDFCYEMKDLKDGEKGEGRKEGI